MTAIQLKAEVMHNINVVAEDENMLNCAQNTCES